MCAYLELFLCAEPRGPCPRVVWSTFGGRQTFCFRILTVLPAATRARVRTCECTLIYNVGSSIYIISVLVYHSHTHPMTRAARPGRFQPSRCGGNSIGDRFPLAVLRPSRADAADGVLVTIPACRSWPVPRTGRIRRALMLWRPWSDWATRLGPTCTPSVCAASADLACARRRLHGQRMASRC